ncbi:MAG: ribonuclease P protein component [Patescibacteria group bacterium]
MLAKTHRLNLKLLSTKSIFLNGFFWKGKLIIANFDFLGGEKNQFAVVIPKKIVSLASARNKLKRLIFNNFPQELVIYKPTNLRLVIRLRHNLDFINHETMLSKDLKSLFTFIQQHGKKT